MAKYSSYRGTQRQHLQRGRYKAKAPKRSYRKERLALQEITRGHNIALGGWLLVFAVLLLDKAIWALPAPVDHSVLRFILSLLMDGLPVGLAFAFLAFSEWLPVWLRPLGRLPAVGILLYMIGDLSVRHTFNMRLAWDEVTPYLDWDTIQNLLTGNPLQTLPFAIMGFSLVLLAAIFAGLLRSLGPTMHRRKQLLAGAGGACLLSAAALLLSPSLEKDPLKWAIADIVSLNAWRGTDRGFDKPSPAVLAESCSVRLTAAPRRIVMVVMESLSSYHSYHWGGINRWTPQLDRVSKRQRAYRNTVANGFNTAGGLVALLTGDVPLQPAASPSDSRLPQFRQQSGDGSNSLLRAATRAGWRTRFLTSGLLQFSGKGQWLKAIGFQQIEGGEHPSYVGKPRFIFNSVADEHLYRRALDAAKEMRAPWMMVLETVSTHPPYVDPASGEYSVEATVKYADGALGQFLQDLRQQEFFKDDRGLVVVVSDHHIMQRGSANGNSPLRGLQQSWDIPLVLITENRTRTLEYATAFQQTDVYNGLRSIVRRISCTNPLRGDIWLEKPAQCQIRLAAGDRNSAWASCEDAQYRVLLDGSDTRVVGVNAEQAPPWLVPAINHMRQRPYLEED